MAIGAGCGETPPDPLPPSAYTEDFDAAWTFIRDTYAYFDHKTVIATVSSHCSRNSSSISTITTRTWA